LGEKDTLRDAYFTYKSRVFDLELKAGLPTGMIGTQRQVVTAAVSKAVSRLKQEMLHDKDLASLIEKVKSHVKT
jgi:serine protease inhibitor ecotin